MRRIPCAGTSLFLTRTSRSIGSTNPQEDHHDHHPRPAHRVAALGDSIIEALRPALRAGQNIYDALYNAYLTDGAIYGETQDGMLRWMEERNQIARLRSEADYIEQRQAMVRDFKRMVGE